MRLVWLFLTALLAASVARGSDRPATAPVSESDDQVAARIGPACGPYSVYAAATCVGRDDVTLPRLVRPEHMTHEEGSTPADLAAAAEAVGLYGLAVQGLTTADLRRTPHPLLLHIRSDVAAERPDHWVCLLPIRGPAPAVLDPWQPDRRFTYSDLTRLWAGDVVAVADRKFSAARIALPTRAVLAAGMAASIACAAALHVLSRRSAGRAIVALIATSGVAACGFHLNADAGYWADRDALGGIEEGYTDAFLATLSVADVAREVAAGAQLIDARGPTQYATGRIGSAVNVNALDVIDPNARVAWPRPVERRYVVYCSDESCGAAKVVARRMRRLGYRDVALFEGGVSEWLAAGGRLETLTP